MSMVRCEESRAEGGEVTFSLGHMYGVEEAVSWAIEGPKIVGYRYFGFNIGRLFIGFIWTVLR